VADGGLGTGYRTLPEWAREGLAEWATGRGDDFLREACRTDSVWPEDDPVSLAGMRLAPGRHGFADYVRSYLAFAYVEERHGTAAVQGIARRLFAGTDVAGAVAEATGLALDRFEEKTRAAAAARIREAATGFAEYRACHLAFLQGRRAEAVDGQRAFLGRMPDSPFAPSARLDLVRALFELGRRDEAGGEIEALLSAPGDRGILEQAEYYAIRIAALEGRRDEVRDRGRRFLRDFVRARPALRAEVESALLAAGPR